MDLLKEQLSRIDNPYLSNMILDYLVLEIDEIHNIYRFLFWLRKNQDLLLL